MENQEEARRGYAYGKRISPDPHLYLETASANASFLPIVTL